MGCAAGRSGAVFPGLCGIIVKWTNESIRMKAVSRVFILVGLLGSLALARPVRAQVTVPQVGEERNKKLRIQFDRTKIRAFEPVYLCVSAERFATAADPEMQLRRDDEPWQPISIPAKAWFKSEIDGPGKLHTQRRGTIMQAATINGTRTWFFDRPGEYKLRVYIGADRTTLALTVVAPEPGEQEAWQVLGDKVDDVLQNNFADQPEQATIDACVRVLRKYPRSQCAAYCQSYISVTRFKVIFERKARSGGKEVYGNVSDELEKLAVNFHESFFGEMTAFYAAYSKGLTHDFQGTLGIANNMTTHLTPWSDGVMEMRTEVLAHITPQVMIVDPNDPKSTTRPTTAPAQIP